MKNLPARLITLPTTQRVFGLDFLRALAISAVLLTHGNLFFPLEQKGWFNSAASFAGVLGVELFFVLSGFLIGTILLSLEGGFNHIRVLPHFWLRRWFRTLPNYWFFLLLYVIATFIVSNPLPNLLSYLTFTQNWLWPHPFFFDQAWSLAVEEWFYLLFPIGLFLFSRFTKSFNTAFLLSAGIFIVLPSAIRIHWALTEDLNWAEHFRKIMFVRLDAIMYGVLAAWFKRTHPMSWSKKRYLFLATGMFLQTVVWLIARDLNFNTSFFAKTFFFPLISLGFAFLLPAADLWNHQTNGPLTTFIRLIALWSYSLYLCNFLFVQVITNIMEMLAITSQFANLGFYVLYLVLSLGMSAVIYTFLEKPAMDIRERLPAG